MRLTRRGWTAVTVVGFALVMSWQYGPRSLNAVVVPTSIAVVAGLLAIGRIGAPTVGKPGVDDGFVGDVRTVQRRVEADETMSATIEVDVGDGLSTPETTRLETTLEAGEETRLAYDLTLEKRGKQYVGGVSITVTDVLGLVERRFDYRSAASVVVYPRVRDLRGGGVDRLMARSATAARGHRGEFDRLREYRRGDPLRDVHWKSAAKRPDGGLLVTEYADQTHEEAVTVAATAASGHEEELATAAASVVDHLLEAGAEVGLALPGDDQPAGSGRKHRRTLLEMLAVVEAGELDDRTRADADVLVEADVGGTTVVVDGEEIPFDRLCADPERGSPEDADRRPAHLAEDDHETSGDSERADDDRRGALA
ncbi:DUF58 domain-containing protein [Natrarchaeobius chitinivorans]|uniref:DUF58 domain-containing protein n=1 Tax=Natrarchaeobius chitinivorans TaxID=1679083 RepID=A0A3N6M3K4_NATCH|nr:DUF58 domain-containing protein [Natrarchaeobius chitinivorans]RQG96497.1 DUF58 domain-containing protein [Natrarchaeobius chitinivorans]